MKKLILYSLLLIAVFTGCEDIYSPEIDSVENVMVVDARIKSGVSVNEIRLYNSRGYINKNAVNEAISGASVSVLDNEGGEIKLEESSKGTFVLKGALNPDLEYKLKIGYRGELFESTFEPVPDVPAIDTVYGIPENKIIKVDGNNDVNDFRGKAGIQLYADILNEKESPYFLFTARKILQYTYQVEIPEPGGVLIESMYGWYSYFPQDYFNIAAPPDYSFSTDISKHPLYFMENKAVINSDQLFEGWILILYQHALSKSAYNFYKDLNNQLVADGRLFDPVYVQARNNLKCTTNPGLLILGNFDISTTSETRYFVKYISAKQGFVLKQIPYFYDISEQGEQLSRIPDFWESEHKSYPNE